MIDRDDINIPHGPGHAEWRPPGACLGRHAQHGEGWTLWFREAGRVTAGVEAYFMPGDLLDIDRIVDQARRHPQMLSET